MTGFSRWMLIGGSSTEERVSGLQTKIRSSSPLTHKRPLDAATTDLKEGRKLSGNMTHLLELALWAMHSPLGPENRNHGFSDCLPAHNFRKLGESSMDSQRLHTDRKRVKDCTGKPASTMSSRCSGNSLHNVVSITVFVSTCPCNAPYSFAPCNLCSLEDRPS
ncbi:hypothetical protein Mapa_013908 [Marchantia paleacea]|nr:hypothetical protein Mapa_013908 [Marchantia paleacea]